MTQPTTHPAIAIATVSAEGHPTASRQGDRHRRWLAGGLALTAMVLTVIGLSGLGDAPNPHASAVEIGEWFTARRADILVAAPFGEAGALSIVVLAAVLADAHRRAAATASARALVAGGVIAATYLFGAHLGWTANAYLIADSSPQGAQAVFAMTITSVPVFALGVTLMAGASAAHRGSPVAGGWWRAARAPVATRSSVGRSAMADRGYFSPDVQQQVIGNLLLAWLLITAIAAFVPARATCDDDNHRPIDRQQPST